MVRNFAWFPLVVSAAFGLTGCGSADRTFGHGGGPHAGGSAGSGAGGEQSPDGSAGGSSGGSDSGAAGSSGAGGTAGGGGQAGHKDAGPVDAGIDHYVPPVVPGRPGMDLVASGSYISSAHYKLVFSVGEGPGGNGVFSSPHYTLKTGLSGTTQP